MNQLLKACNHAAQKCGHSGLYTGGEGDGPMEGNKILEPAKSGISTQDDRSAYFHVSIAWNLSEPDPEWISLVQDIDVDVHIQSLEAVIDAVKVKIGNTVNSIALGVRRSDRGKGCGSMGRE